MKYITLGLAGFLLNIVVENCYGRKIPCNCRVARNLQNQNCFECNYILAFIASGGA